MKHIYLVSDFETFLILRDAVSSTHSWPECNVSCVSLGIAHRQIEKADPQNLALTVVIIDLHRYRQLEGVELAQKIAGKLPDVPIIFLTPDAEQVNSMASADGITVSAFVDKTSELFAREIVLALETAFQNTKQAAPEVMLMD